jgi:hypothetical protein
MLDKRIEHRGADPLPLSIDRKILTPIAAAELHAFRNENAIITPEWHFPENLIFI